MASGTSQAPDGFVGSFTVNDNQTGIEPPTPGVKGWRQNADFGKCIYSLRLCTTGLNMPWIDRLLDLKT